MTSPQPQSPPACAADPELWFDKSQTTHALRECLACPIRPWCAEEAIRIRASFGMWAGIFINENLPEVAPLLLAIAQSPADETGAGPDPAPQHRPPSGPSITSPTHRVNAVLAAVWARSSGHCEIMTQHCRLTFDTLGSRVAGRDPWTLERASDAYAVCRPCAAALDAAEPQFVERLGIVVRPPYEPAYTRFFWRQAQWVYLDGGSRICSAGADFTRKAL